MRKLFLDPLGQSHCADGADEAAEVASDAFGADDVRLSGVGVESDGLVSAVSARDIAASAADAFFSVDGREDLSVAVEVSRPYECW